MATELAPKVINGIKIDAGDIALLQKKLDDIDKINTQINNWNIEYLTWLGKVDIERTAYYNCDNLTINGHDATNKQKENCKDAVTINWSIAESKRDTALINYNTLKDISLPAAKIDYNQTLSAVENKIKLQIQGQTTTTQSQIALIQANQAGSIANTKIEQSAKTKKYVIFGIIIIVVIIAGVMIFKKII